jgi:hypothetical protein
MKSIRSLVLLTLTFLLLAGCGSMRTRLTECDHPSGWCKEIRELAAHAWPYAQLSSNVYLKEDQFDLAGRFRELSVHENKNIGFYATLYEDTRNQQLVFVVRGTDDIEDWTRGNFRPNQNEFGLATTRAVKAKYPGRPLVVAGHSLGGGVAMHISLNEKVDRTYSFNGSPHFRANGQREESDRYSIAEFGEINKLIRVFGREATQLYTSIGCSHGDPLRQHAQFLLATCLTQIAAVHDTEAAKSLERNKLTSPYARPAP